MKRKKYKTKKKNIIKLDAFYEKFNKEINNKDGKRNLSR